MARRFRDPAAALEHLLEVSERNPGQTRILAYPDYAGMESEEERRTFHRVMEDAEAAQAISLKRDRHAGPADIRFFALADAGRLAAHLRRTPAATEAEQAVSHLRREAGELPQWVGDILSEIAGAWAVRREPYPGLGPGDVQSAAKFLRILAAIDRGEHLNGWDMRTFSRRACGDSKAVESGMARLARALRIKYALPDVAPREVLAALGVEKFAQPILIRACLRLPDGTTVKGSPYIGLPPEWAVEATPLGEVPYVLTIENLASFNRHVREIKDSGVILFSAGFPSKSTLGTIKHLDNVLAPGVPFFHWGDTDRHGFLIHAHIAAAIRRPLTTHLMDEEGREQEECDPCSPTAFGKLTA